MILYIINVIVLALFIGTLLYDRRSLLNGFLCINTLIITFLSLVYFSNTQEITILKNVLYYIESLIFVMAFLQMFIILGVSLVNTITLMTKEKIRMSNLCSLIVSVCIIVWWFISVTYMRAVEPNKILFYTFIAISALTAYFVFMFMVFFVSVILYHFYRPSLDQDYIIVLGAGLKDGKEVTPLLARRVDRAISIYHRQLQQGKKTITFIMSGGKGSDEKISEAQAMKNYALQQGIPEEHIILEERSRNTLENMLFSKEIIANKKLDKPVHILFSTSNYHVFRAAIYARKARLQAHGVGAKTPFYFWYNAILREFIAILFLYCKAQIIIISSMATFTMVFIYIMRWIA